MQKKWQDMLSLTKYYHKKTVGNIKVTKFNILTQSHWISPFILCFKDDGMFCERKALRWSVQLKVLNNNSNTLWFDIHGSTFSAGVFVQCIKSIVLTSIAMFHILRLILISWKNIIS